MRDTACRFRSRRFAPWKSAESTASRASQSSTSIWRGGMCCAALSPAARSSTWAATAPIFDADGNPAPWLQQIDSISGNGRHAIVIAPELVRIEMLRIGHTYELAITRLWLKSEEGHTRPAIVTAPLFRGHQGTLAVELWNAENKVLRGSVAPAFYTAAGEVLDLPERFDEAIRKISGAVACPGCKHTHVAAAPVTNKGREL